jgi:hypothetical protein
MGGYGDDGHYRFKVYMDGMMEAETYKLWEY